MAPMAGAEVPAGYVPQGCAPINDLRSWVGTNDIPEGLHAEAAVGFILQVAPAGCVANCTI